ncbi:MAG: DUF3084 domain-containing protein [Candidatus Eremiobacteraeota bacterium]|nr:DUF3084 domain-containing protein [Candidatus Eremiobacteraeota bacterium]
MGDFIRGTLIVIGIVLIAGVIAYIGDRVGHQVGRRRLSLFGIRPRYTSTIIAVGTGMLIALFLTVVTLIASNTVKTAFFHLNAVNSRITQLQAQADELSRHVRNEQVVVGVGDQMYPDIALLPQNDPISDRYVRLREYYGRVAAFANEQYVPRGLKKFVSPPDADKRLQEQSGSVELTAALSQSPVVTVALADENLFRNDPIHFDFRFLRDLLMFPAGAPIASFVVPANPNNDVRFILVQLEQLVTESAVRNLMPIYFAQRVAIVGGPANLQRTLQGSGNYRITARAAANVYPHVRGIPIIIQLNKV